MVMSFFLSFGVVFLRLKMCISNLEYKGVHLKNQTESRKLRVQVKLKSEHKYRSAE